VAEHTLVVVEAEVTVELVELVGLAAAGLV
jgi:hypothetical protein